MKAVRFYQAWTRKWWAVLDDGRTVPVQVVLSEHARLAHAAGIPIYDFVRSIVQEWPE